MRAAGEIMSRQTWTGLAMTRSSVAHDRAGCVTCSSAHDWHTKNGKETPCAHNRDTLSPKTKSGARDKHASEAGRRARQRRGNNALVAHTVRPGRTHDTGVHATKEFCHDIDSLSRQTCPVAKKKKDPRD